MSTRDEHRERWSGDIAAYALGALDRREATELERHLTDCDSCRAELEWLQPAVDVIPASVEQLEPPPALRERLLATVREEAAPAAEPATARKRERRLRLPLIGEIGLRPALGMAAAVLLVIAVFAGYELRSTTEDGGGPAAETYTATVEAPGVRVDATLEVHGDEGVLHIEGMPPPKPNQVYQAWIEEPVQGGAAKVRASSVFVVAENGTGDVMIPHGLANADRVMITREPKGGSDRPSEPAMMTLEMS